MTTWELIAEKAKDLPPEKQQEVLDFVESVRARAARSGPAAKRAEAVPPASALGARLRMIRERIEASGEPMLDADQVLREVAERRGGVSALEGRGDEDVR
jgi:hypothetical protein